MLAFAAMIKVYREVKGKGEGGRDASDWTNRYHAILSESLVEGEEPGGESRREPEHDDQSSLQEIERRRAHVRSYIALIEDSLCDFPGLPVDGVRDLVSVARKHIDAIANRYTDIVGFAYEVFCERLYHPGSHAPTPPGRTVDEAGPFIVKRNVFSRFPQLPKPADWMHFGYPPGYNPFASCIPEPKSVETGGGIDGVDGDSVADRVDSVDPRGEEYIRSMTEKDQDGFDLLSIAERECPGANASSGETDVVNSFVQSKYATLGAKERNYDCSKLLLALLDRGSVVGERGSTMSQAVWFTTADTTPFMTGSEKTGLVSMTSTAVRTGTGVSRCCGSTRLECVDRRARRLLECVCRRVRLLERVGRRVRMCRPPPRTPALTRARVFVCVCVFVLTDQRAVWK